MNLRNILNSMPFRRKLLLLFLVIFLPAFGLIVANGISLRRQAIAKAQDNASLLARSLAAQQEQIAIATKTMLSTMALLPEVQNRDAPACTRLFRELHQKYPFYSVILACAPDGNVFAASEVFQPLSVSDRKYFQDVLKSFDFSIGEFIVGRISKVNSLHYAIPVFNVQKKLVAVLVAGFNLQEFSRFLSMVNLPEGSAVVFTDHKMVRIYRMPENGATPIGKLSLFKGYFDSIPSSIAEGLFEWRALDGVMRINAFKKLRLREDSPPYLYIIVGLPKEAIIDEANLKMLRNLLILGLAALLALSLAWILGNMFIIKPINRLVAATQQFGRGNLDTRTGLPHTRDELGRLAQSFDDMAILLEKRNRERQEAGEALSHACDELETRVQKRTAELSTLNQTLQLEICERAQAQEALQESEKTLRALLDANPESVLVLDNSLTLITANKTAAQRLGQSLDDIIGVRLLDLIPAEVMNRRKPYFDKVLRTGKAVQFEDVRAGIHFYTHIYPIPDAAGKVSKVATLGIDITERKMAEEALRQTSETLQTLINVAPLAIYVFDPEGRVQLWNKASERIFGWSEEEVLGRLVPFIPEDKLEEFGSILGRSLKGEPSSRIELTCRKKDGSLVEISLRTTPLNDEHGKVTAVMSISADITERKQAEEALRQAEEKYRSIFENAVEGIFQSTPEGRYISANPAMARMFGYESPEELMADITDIATQVYVDPQHRAHFRRLMAKDGVVKDFEYQIHRKGGGSLWLSENARAVLNEKGNILYFEGIMQDISDRKEAENKLAKLRHHQELILNSVWEGIVGLDLKGRITFANLAAARMLGYRAEELLGRDSHSAWHHSKPDGSPYPVRECPLHVALEQGDTIYNAEDVFWRQDGTSFPVKYSLAPILERGEVFEGTGGVLTFFDTSQQKEEQALTRSLIARSLVGIYLMQDRKFVLTNRWVHKITGYNEEELADLDPWILVHPEDREGVRINALKMLRGESFTPSEFRYITKGGETKWVMETVTSVQYKGKRATLGYFMDITERKELEAQLINVQKMEAVGTLAGGIAHDFNNILTAILGNIGLAMIYGEIGPRVQDRLAKAEEACWRAQALSQQLLTFAKGGAPVKKLFSVAELLTESIPFTCVGSPVKGETTCPENLWWIEADPGQIGQVFQNITINAIQAMPTGGTIKVWAENLTLGTDSDLPLSAGRYIKISVRDQGMGIPAEHLPRIFDPYFTTKQKGSGLGLASAYAIIKKHDGHIAVESKPGVVTTFYIYLPAVEGQVTPQPEEDRELLVGTGKILAMDDDEMVWEVLERMLVHLGYEPEFARDGGEAIEMFVKAQESGQAFAAVILDLTVPGGMGGKEALAKLLEIDPQVKAIVSSGYSDDLVMADFQKYGFSGVIAKPYKISELGKVLNKALTGKE